MGLLYLKLGASRTQGRFWRGLINYKFDDPKTSLWLGSIYAAGRSSRHVTIGSVFGVAPDSASAATARKNLRQFFGDDVLPAGGN